MRHIKLKIKVAMYVFIHEEARNIFCDLGMTGKIQNKITILSVT